MLGFLSRVRTQGFRMQNLCTKINIEMCDDFKTKERFRKVS